METALPPKKISGLITRIMGGISALLAAMWGLITYVFPDPTVFGLSFLNWKNVILFMSAFVFLSVIFLGWYANRLPQMLKGAMLVILSAGLAVIFFALGGEYAKPSFDFARNQQKFIENGGANMLGKRIEVIDGVRIELLGCEKIGRSPNCDFELTNTRLDGEFHFNSDTSLFEETGGALNIDKMQVGSSKFMNRETFPVVRGVPTRVRLAFEQGRGDLQNSPALKLSVRTNHGDDSVVKFNDVEIK
jgi:hypothetical protein